MDGSEGSATHVKCSERTLSDHFVFDYHHNIIIACSIHSIQHMIQLCDELISISGYNGSAGP